MKPTIVYVYPPGLAANTEDYALRFVASYHEHPPGLDHDTIIVVNGKPITFEEQMIFSSLRNVRYLFHDDSGWDIGAFQLASKFCPDSDFAVFFGTSVYFKAHFWLSRMAQAVQRRGPGLFGCHGNRGVPTHSVWPHVRTTGFFLDPKLFNRYPIQVKDHTKRYEFEHGRTSLAEWIKQQGLKTWVVTRFGEYQWEQWDLIPNGFHRGDQSALLVGDRLSEPPYYATP